MTRTARTDRPRRRRTLATTVLAALLAAAASGCGAPSGDDVPAARATGQAGPDAATDATADPAAPADPAATTGAQTPASTPAGAPASGAGGATTATSSAPAPASPPVVTVDDFAYDVPSSVLPGADVEVSNLDVETHTLTSPDGAFAVTVPVGGTGTFRAPTEPGDYRFVCLLHGGMEGVLTVR